MSGLSMEKAKLLSSVHYGGKKYPYGVLRQPFAELAYNDNASLPHQKTSQHCCGGSLANTASPRWPCLGCGAQRQPLLHNSSITEVCYEAQLCTGPQRL